MWILIFSLAHIERRDLHSVSVVWAYIWVLFHMDNWGKLKVDLIFLNLHYKDEITNPIWKTTEIKQKTPVFWELLWKNRKLNPRPIGLLSDCKHLLGNISSIQVLLAAPMLTGMGSSGIVCVPPPHSRLWKITGGMQGAACLRTEF